MKKYQCTQKHNKHFPEPESITERAIFRVEPDNGNLYHGYVQAGQFFYLCGPVKEIPIE